MEKSHQSQNVSSRPPSRRTSGSNVRETLPTPPPDPRAYHSNETIFQYPSIKTSEIASLPNAFQSILNYSEQEKEFYRSLNEIIAKDCPQGHGHTQANKSASSQSIATSASASTLQNEDQQCHCDRMRRECEQYIDPLNSRRNQSISAALAAYGAFEQLNRLYALWDRYLETERQLHRRKERLRYVNLMQEKLQSSEKDAKLVDTELDQSIALLDTILATGNSASLKRSQLKQQRERSKSVIVDDASSNHGRIGDSKSTTSSSHGLPPLRRQSTYCEGKSKVSKWTKVKAAFKWERANMPALTEGTKELSNGVGLVPVNYEVARYLRVPSLPCGGGSSADSILSSSSGHFLSETGTPGTVSSASSMDDIENTGRSTLRRDSSKSDSRSETRKLDDNEYLMQLHALSGESSFEMDNQKLMRCDSSKSAASAATVAPAKSSSNKSIRRSKIVSDFESLPEGAIADIRCTPTRRLKPPPSPLDLNLKQDLNDLDGFYSPHLLKSPKDGTQSLNRIKKLSSPGNSSVPSSPSRHSEFFAEFESEDISSGDFSEPSSPSRKTFQQKQDEINQKYQMLRATLDMEFESKRREWEKIKANSSAARTIPRIPNVAKSEEHSPNLPYNAKLLEENLSPDFKKKLRKWRVKKQISVQSSGGQASCSVPVPAPTMGSPNSPNKDIVCESKPKIDWNLWKTGLIKFEGQGLTPLPDQKDLPEDFQKKLEQWNKIKRGGSVTSSGGGGGGGADCNTIKRNSKHGDSTKKSSDDDRGSCAEKEKRSDKHKSHEKDKFEKFPKLKAIVGDHQTKAKEIEVKTSAGVMKFEGISRKFTRKLYEWEKARGIGPELSTFALLHPGYCPIDVGRIPKDNNKNNNSPTLSRSFSLDSVSPCFALPASISHQASSLSLNDMKSDLDGVSSSDPLGDSEFKKFEEPEAVMVEVEDDIVETASPLITANTRIEKQTPVYKYEEVACNDICNTKRIQSFESHTNLGPLLSALKRFDEIFGSLKKAAPEVMDREEVRRCYSSIALVRNIYPYYTENLTKANVLNAISDVQSELSRVSELSIKSPLDEACCQEIFEERNKEYKEEFEGLCESLNLLRQSIQGTTNRYPCNIVPDINITTDDNTNDDVSLQYTTCDTTTSRDQLSTTLEATDELSATSQVENDTETTTTTTTQHTTVQRSFSNATANGSIGKKKLRLRKMGSRQNSKTESSNSSDDDNILNALETPRRLKRKNFRLKQRSFDDDFRRNPEDPNLFSEEQPAYMLKIKPCSSRDQRENSIAKQAPNPREAFAQFIPIERQLSTGTEAVSVADANCNVFVKTKRRVFTTVEQPTAIDGIAVVSHDLDGNIVEESSQDNNNDTPTNEEEEVEEEEKAGKEEVVKDSTEVEMPKLSKNLVKARKRLSLSQNDVRKMPLPPPLSSLDSIVDERRCHSVESIRTITKNIRRPLATDSFKKINKNCISMVMRDEFTNSVNTPKRMELRFKKNPDLFYLQHPKVNSSRVVKKIESKIAKSSSGTSVESHIPSYITPNNNSLKRNAQQLKIDRKSLTPTLMNLQMADFPTVTLPSPLKSAPTTPMTETQPLNKPSTPLSERAQRLRKAKEEFLQGTMPRSKPSFKRRDEIVRSETWEQNRRSDHSLSSTTTGGGDESSSDFLKSLSADTIRGGGGGTSGTSAIEDTPTQSDAGTDQDVSFGVYDSLSRTVTRSGKISSKLGFATLASKFRRAKVKNKNKDTNSGSSGGGGGALSTLCRQTLFADVTALPQAIPQESVMKSQSTPFNRVSLNPAPTQSSYLNKSQSEQYVRHAQKESYV